MGGDASIMPPAPGADPNMMGGDPNAMPPAGDPNMMGDPNAMGGDPNMMGNEPVMGADPFGGEGSADVSGDPEKKAESLAGQLASIFRNDLANDGINKHEDKKKEVLGMVASAVVDGMSDEDRNSMIEYLSDKLNGSGESDGDESSDGDSNDQGGDQGDMDDPNAMGGDPNAMPPAGDSNMMGDPNAMGDDQSQQMMENRVNEVVNKILKEITGANDTTKAKKPENKSKVEQEAQKGYKATPYTK